MSLLQTRFAEKRKGICLQIYDKTAKYTIFLDLYTKDRLLLDPFSHKSHHFFMIHLISSRKKFIFAQKN